MFGAHGERFFAGAFGFLFLAVRPFDGRAHPVGENIERRYQNQAAQNGEHQMPRHPYHRVERRHPRLNGVEMLARSHPQTIKRDVKHQRAQQCHDNHRLVLPPKTLSASRLNFRYHRFDL